MEFVISLLEYWLQETHPRDINGVIVSSQRWTEFDLLDQHLLICVTTNQKDCSTFTFTFLQVTMRFGFCVMICNFKTFYLFYPSLTHQCFTFLVFNQMIDRKQTSLGLDPSLEYALEMLKQVRMSNYFGLHQNLSELDCQTYLFISI